MKDSCNKAWVRGIMTIVKPILGLKTVGAGHIRAATQSSVFVCNHGVIVGPVAAIIYLPAHFRPWIHDRMLSPDESTETMMGTFQNRFNWLGQKRKKRLLKHLAEIMSKAMAAFNPIPVSRTDPMKMMPTIQESLDTLLSGDNLLIFPENPQEHYNTDSYRNLHPAFGILGHLYYQKTRKELAFYPCFTDTKHKRFSIGTPILYSPSGDIEGSIRDLVSRVQESMIQLSNSNS
jgi:hypothetical protein